MVDLTHDDDDTNCHMPNIPLQPPPTAHFPSNFLTSSELSCANVHSLQPIPTQIGVNPQQLQYLVTYPQSVFAVLWTSRSCSIRYTTSTRSSVRSARKKRLCTISAQRRDVLHSINRGKFLLPLIKMKKIRKKAQFTIWAEMIENRN